MNSVFSLIGFIAQLVSIYSMLCFIRIILSWIPQFSYSKVAQISGMRFVQLFCIFHLTNSAGGGIMEFWRTLELCRSRPPRQTKRRDYFPSSLSSLTTSSKTSAHHSACCFSVRLRYLFDRV